MSALPLIMEVSLFRRAAFFIIYSGVSQPVIENCCTVIRDGINDHRDDQSKQRRYNPIRRIKCADDANEIGSNCGYVPTVELVRVGEIVFRAVAKVIVHDHRPNQRRDDTGQCVDPGDEMLI